MLNVDYFNVVIISNSFNLKINNRLADFYSIYQASLWNKSSKVRFPVQSCTMNVHYTITFIKIYISYHFHIHQTITIVQRIYEYISQSFLTVINLGKVFRNLIKYLIWRYFPFSSNSDKCSTKRKYSYLEEKYLKFILNNFLIQTFLNNFFFKLTSFLLKILFIKFNHRLRVFKLMIIYYLFLWRIHISFDI